RPTGSPSVVAMRSAAALAAIRRGSSMTIRPSTSRAAPRASGTRVVLPAPGGATSTARPASPRAAISAGSAASLGSVAFTPALSPFQQAFAIERVHAHLGRAQHAVAERAVVQAEGESLLFGHLLGREPFQPPILSGTGHALGTGCGRAQHHLAAALAVEHEQRQFAGFGLRDVAQGGEGSGQGIDRARLRRGVDVALARRPRRVVYLHLRN